MYGDETSSHSFFSLESTKQMIVILLSIHLVHLVHLERIKLEIFFSPIP